MSAGRSCGWIARALLLFGAVVAIVGCSEPEPEPETEQPAADERGAPEECAR